MGLSSFVKTEMELLADDYEVIPFAYSPSRTMVGKAMNAVRALWHACRTIPGSHRVYSYFAGYHCFFHFVLAKVWHTPAIVMVGGFDTAAIPVLSYGVFYKPSLLQFCVRCVYSAATAIGVVDATLLHFRNTFADPSGEGYSTGLLAFMPSLKNRIHIVRGAADSTFWHLPEEDLHRVGVIFVAVVREHRTFVAKGGDILLRMAAEMPDIQFTLAGIDTSYADNIKKNCPPNIVILPMLSANELRGEYWKHSVFVLPSRTEGLPNVLCEAMLCGCIPVVSAVNGMPQAVQGIGKVVDTQSTSEWGNAVRDVLHGDSQLRLMAYKRIAEEYSLMRRKAALRFLIGIPS